jgi:pimeloyl-ACP methyl ester carboxylesterase
MLQLSDLYTQRETGGKYSNETAALYAVSCVDGRAPRTVAGVQRLADAARRVAPHVGAATVWLGLPCTYWPAPAQADVRPLHASGTGPLLVIGNTGDPATPYEWAQSLARQLRAGHLLTYEGTGHTAYGQGSACVDDAVDAYLLELTIPATTTC